MSVAVFFLCKSLNRYQESFRQTSLLRNWPIPKVEIEQFDARFMPEAQGPSKATEIVFIGGQGSVSDMEAWILCTFAKSSLNVFEFGTFAGKTTYLLAKNAPKKGKIFTLTLAPEGHSAYKASKGDNAKDTKSALHESIFNTFYYTNTPVASKITQLFADSKLFDESPYVGKMDLIFIDGSHAHSYVESDTQKALKMLKPGGVIFWHDYRGPNRVPGVFQTLNKLQKDLNLVHIAGTNLVAYKKP